MLLKQGEGGGGSAVGRAHTDLAVQPGTDAGDEG
jgi:hypothetical protein